MRNYSLTPELRDKLDKLYRKDRALFGALKSKMDEIAACPSPEHYKNLRAPLNRFKRVHVKKSFVLLFMYSRESDEVCFYDFLHHDAAYL